MEYKKKLVVEKLVVTGEALVPESNKPSSPITRKESPNHLPGTNFMKHEQYDPQKEGTVGLAWLARNSERLGGILAKYWALLDSPTFVGTPKAPTPPMDSSDTRIATTEFVNRRIHEEMGTLLTQGQYHHEISFNTPFTEIKYWNLMVMRTENYDGAVYYGNVQHKKIEFQLDATGKIQGIVLDILESEDLDNTEIKYLFKGI